MAVRHVTSLDNIDAEGFLVDPSKACHGSISGGRLEDLSGLVDPLTHLNRDFPDHQLGECVVAERLERGGKVVVGPDGTFLRARPRPAGYTPLGRIDIDERRIAWLAVLHERRKEGNRARS